MTNTKIMGIVNVTPDSFSDGGQFDDADQAINHALTMCEAGADILDIGGESTRPGAATISEPQELSRVLPVIEGLVRKSAIPISIDTRKPGVALQAVQAGAKIWNDVSALTFDPSSVEIAAETDCDIVLMHAQGDPETMQKNPQYGDVVEDVYAFLSRRIEACAASGISLERLIIDPGIGFGKTLAHNVALLGGLDRFASLGPRLLLGASRKRFIAAIDRESDASDRLGGSLAAAIAGKVGGVDILRVHDVVPTRQALAVWSAIQQATSGTKR